ncbi:O-antigen ligase family protein [Sphingorhabdus lacus]|jgi:O-antigen ligase|uniref:O-antigen ligase family protein n=1 Tax=Sphingorhabdus lacus TaxID=392610 RepID=UPI0035943D14
MKVGSLVDRAFGHNFWALAIYLTLVFLTGGSSRLDVESLAILRPASIFFCGIALFNLQRTQVKSYKFIIIFMLLVLALGISHIIPISSSWTLGLPGRDLFATLAHMDSSQLVWRPLSLFPLATVNSLASLAVPVTVLLFGIQLNDRELMGILPLIILFGLISIFLAFVQIIGDPQSPMYLYRITNNGSAVGLFANRNHHALFLAMLLPMLGIFASKNRRLPQFVSLKSSLLIAATTVIIPLLLVTGSRAGLLAGMLGLTFMILIFRNVQSEHIPTSEDKKRRVRSFATGLGIISLIAITLAMSRAESIYRLIGSESSESLRFKTWGPIAEVANSLFPFGSGIGTFAVQYQVHEQTRLLIPFYPNQAHNDALDIYLTSGLLGVALILIATIGWLRASSKLYQYRHKRDREIAFGKLGALCVGLIFGCSLVDYPVRTPIIGALLSICALWAQMGILKAQAIASTTNRLTTKHAEKDDMHKA